MSAALVEPSRAERWKSKDGKEIVADFVRMEGDFVVLRMKEKEYKIDIQKLDEASVKKAQDIHSALDKQAEETAGLPILEEEVLAKLLASSPSPFEGKQFLLKGKAVTVSLPDGTPLMAATRGKGEGIIVPGNKVQVTFAGGSKAVLDFSTKVAASINPTFKRNARLEIADNKAVLMTLDRFMNNNSTWQPREELILPGQVFTVHADVRAGAVVCGREATRQEIHEAETKMRQMRK